MARPPSVHLFPDPGLAVFAKPQSLRHGQGIELRQWDRLPSVFRSGRQPVGRCAGCRREQGAHWDFSRPTAPFDTRGGGVADVTSPPRTIEVKAFGGIARGPDLRLETTQVQRGARRMVDGRWSACPTPPLLPFLHPPIELASLGPHRRLHLDRRIDFAAICFGALLHVIVAEIDI